MKSKISGIAFVLFVLIALSTRQSSAPASAQSGSGYDLTWITIDGGGGSSSGGGYTLAGTIGQPDAETVSGGGYTLNGGFWPGAGSLFSVFLSLILR